MSSHEILGKATSTVEETQEAGGGPRKPFFRRLRPRVRPALDVSQKGRDGVSASAFCLKLVDQRWSRRCPRPERAQVWGWGRRVSGGRRVRVRVVFPLDAVSGVSWVDATDVCAAGGTRGAAQAGVAIWVERGGALGWGTFAVGVVRDRDRGRARAHFWTGLGGPRSRGT